MASGGGAPPSTPSPRPPGSDDQNSEENLATTSAQLIVTLKNITRIPVQDVNQFLGLYCIITFDKQQVLTDAGMAKPTKSEDGQTLIGCDWTDVIKFDVTQSLASSYLSISVWGKNNEGTTSLGSARFALSGISTNGVQDVDVSVRLNKERKFIPTVSASPGSGKLGIAISKSPMKSPITSGSSKHVDIRSDSKTTSSSSSTTVSSFVTPVKTTKTGVREETPSSTPDSSSPSKVAHLIMSVKIQKQKTKVSENDFEKLRVIGRGTFGKVFQARKRDTGRIYAMKVLKKDHVVKNNAVKHTMSENHVLKNINHPFIVNLKYAFQTKSHLYMVIDYLNGGELFYHLTHDDYFPEPRAKLYAAEVVSALGYLHDHNILYRDLKPENLILDMHGHICLVDFGLCKVGWMPETKTYTFCGSAEYLSPELLRGKGYGKEVDWWALGTLIYEMLSGLPPFWDEDEEYMQKKIVSAPLKMHKYFSAEAKDIIRQLLNRDPEQRLGSGPKGTQQIKSHPWFAEIDWAALDRRELTPHFVPHLKNEQDLPYVEPEVLSELPALSLTTASLHLDGDLFAGFSYDSEAIHAHMAAAAGSASKRGSSSRRDTAPGRRGRTDSAAAARMSRGEENSFSDDDSDNDGGIPSTPSSQGPGSGRWRRTPNNTTSGNSTANVGASSSKASSVKTDSGLIFDLEDSNGDL